MLCKCMASFWHRIVPISTYYRTMPCPSSLGDAICKVWTRSHAALGWVECWEFQQASTDWIWSNMIRYYDIIIYYPLLSYDWIQESSISLGFCLDLLWLLSCCLDWNALWVHIQMTSSGFLLTRWVDAIAMRGLNGAPSPLAAALCEQLRTILEPTLKGLGRLGRRALSADGQHSALDADACTAWRCMKYRGQFRKSTSCPTSCPTLWSRPFQWQVVFKDTSELGRGSRCDEYCSQMLPNLQKGKEIIRGSHRSRDDMGGKS